jgi:hypothetical protein
MFNPTEVLIEAFVERLQQEYRRMYGVLEPSYPGIIAWAGRMALENIANTVDRQSVCACLCHGTR